MKKIFAVLFMAVCGLASAQQSVPAQTTLDSQVWFGSTSVDLEHARIVDITPGNNKITDALGVVHSGYFMGTNTFANTPAFKKYIRAYAGSNLFYNTAMFTSPDCPSGSTRLSWITGGITELTGDQCSLKQQVMQYARNN